MTWGRGVLGRMNAAFVAAVVCVAVAALFAPAADAAYPPAKNGKIVASGLNATGNLDIFIMAADGSNAVDVTPSGGVDETTPQFSPDGRQIVFTRQAEAGSHILVMNADGSKVRDLTSTSTQTNSSPTFTPDGKRIVFIGDADPDPGKSVGTVSIMNADGTGVRDLTPGQNQPEGNPDVSPDGRFIAFDRVLGLEVFPREPMQMPIGGGTAGLLLSKIGDNRDPAYSPDGRTLTFTGTTEPRLNIVHEIWVISRTRQGERDVTAFGEDAFSQHPAFSPDGSQIAFDNPATAPPGDGALRIIRSNSYLGTGTPIQATMIEPSWQYVYLCAGRRATIVGDDGRERIRGTKKRDVIVTNDGKDRVNAGPGSDLVCGGDGKDTLIGGPGKDRLIGGKGKDRLIGGKGKDHLIGGKGKDVSRP